MTSLQIYFHVVILRCHVNCMFFHNFEADYESYLEIMKEHAINMASDYIPDRPGF